MGALLLAVGGVGAAAKETDAATIMMPGEIVPRTEVTEQPQYAVALTNGDIDYTIGHADGAANATMTWFGVESPAYLLERYVDTGSDVPSTVMSPDQLNDGNRSMFFLVETNLPELSSLRYALDSRFPDGSEANLFRFLENAEVRAGFGPLTGNPQNIDEATAMTDGPVMRAVYSGNVELDDAWILRPQQPSLAPGDYNGDGVVDAADYGFWKDRFGATVPPGIGADGSGNGMIDAADYTVWRDHLAPAAGAAAVTRATEAAATPEPTTLALAGTALAGIGLAVRRRVKEALGRTL